MTSAVTATNAGRDQRDAAIYDAPVDQVMPMAFAERPRGRSEGHEHHVALLLTEGKVVFECEGTIELTAPGLAVIPAGSPHAFLDADAQAAGWAFAGTQVGPAIRCASRSISLTRDRADALSLLLARIDKERNEALPYARPAIDALWVLVGVELARACNEKRSRLTDAATEAIARLANSPLRPRDVAQLLGVTPAHLSHEVSRTTGRTLTQWIAEARVSRVRELLLASNASVEKIAEQLGYPDATQLSREFKRVTGTSPGAWRANSATLAAK